MSEKRIIRHVGRDYHEIGKVEGNLITGASDQAQQLVQSFTPQASPEDVLKLLTLIQQEITRLSIPADAKEQLDDAVQEAAIQVKKDPPKKQKFLEKLKNATAVLKESGVTMKEAVVLGNLLGKAVEWGGEQWIEWMM